MTNSFLDFTVSSIETSTLTTEHIQQAAQLANALPELEEQWQAYLNILGLLGFEKWLNQRDPRLVLERDDFRQVLNTICHLKVGKVKLCLLTQGMLDDQTITLPQTALESTNDLAHFYVLIVVDEEQEQVSIEGVICYEELRNYQETGNLPLETDQTYEIPLSWFDSDVNHLLLYLRCLEPSEIQLTNTLAVQESVENTQSKLMQPFLNVGSWLRGELDELAESLSWVLLPSYEMAANFRSLPTLDTIIQELNQQGLTIPKRARGASYNVNIGEISLNLSALVWLMEAENEWSLLLILGSPKDEPLPDGLKMQVRDSTSIISEQEIAPNRDQAHLYTVVIGEPDEQFIVTITSPNGQTLRLPPITFCSE